MYGFLGAVHRAVVLNDGEEDVREDVRQVLDRRIVFLLSWWALERPYTGWPYGYVEGVHDSAV